jgi:hypothetical protein
MATIVNGERCVPSSECTWRDSMCFFPEFNSLVSWGVIIGGHAAYLVVIAALVTFMRGRKPFELKTAMMLYNALQVVLSGTMTYQLGHYLYFDVFNLRGPFCPRIEFWILVHYVTKYLDMLDTVFMALRKKNDQISFLHVYHHLTIGAIWGTLLHTGSANGSGFFGAWINSLIHTLMYFHYLWTALGFRNPLKKYLTQLQMLQFALCILHAVLIAKEETPDLARWGYLQLTYHCTLLYLFMRFYLAYTRKDSAAVAKPESKKD